MDTSSPIFYRARTTIFYIYRQYSITELKVELKGSSHVALLDISTELYTYTSHLAWLILDSKISIQVLCSK